jgi:hypothetical protein
MVKASIQDHEIQLLVLKSGHFPGKEIK